jgi:hypothetical protein
MANPITRLPEPGRRHIHPSYWPTWVLRWSAGYNPNDQTRKAQRGFRAWQRARAEWRQEFTGLTAGAFAQTAERELRRRHPRPHVE